MYENDNKSLIKKTSSYVMLHDNTDLNSGLFLFDEEIEYIYSNITSNITTSNTELLKNQILNVSYPYNNFHNFYLASKNLQAEMMKIASMYGMVIIQNGALCCSEKSASVVRIKNMGYVRNISIHL